jgi:hypothetical protein
MISAPFYHRQLLQTETESKRLKQEMQTTDSTRAPKNTALLNRKAQAISRSPEA